MKRLLGLLMAVMVMMGGISWAVAENTTPIVSDWLTAVGGDGDAVQHDRFCGKLLDENVGAGGIYDYADAGG